MILRWWMEGGQLAFGNPSSVAPLFLLPFTRASHTNWGVHLDEFTVAGDWSRQDAALHISTLEVRAVLFSHFAILRLNHWLLTRIDEKKSSLVVYLNKRGTVSLLRCQLTHMGRTPSLVIFRGGRI